MMLQMRYFNLFQSYDLPDAPMSCFFTIQKICLKFLQKVGGGFVWGWRIASPLKFKQNPYSSFFLIILGPRSKTRQFHTSLDDNLSYEIAYGGQALLPGVLFDIQSIEAIGSNLRKNMLLVVF